MSPKKKAAVKKVAASQKPAKVGDVLSQKYAKDFLKQVIVRVDFARPLNIPKKGPKASFKNAMPEFPILSLETKTLKHLSLENSGAIKETTELLDEWTLENDKESKKAVLSKSTFFFNYLAYPGFAKLRAEFLNGFDALCRLYQDELVVSRLGLRYINQIEIDENNLTDWNKWLIPDLLSTFNLADDVDTISRAFNVLEFSYPDETKMRFQYGMPNPDYPAIFKRKMFVLDYDAYVASSIEPGGIAGLLDTFYLKRIKPAFEQVITNELRKRMEPKSVSKHAKK